MASAVSLADRQIVLYREESAMRDLVVKGNALRQKTDEVDQRIKKNGEKLEKLKAALMALRAGKIAQMIPNITSTPLDAGPMSNAFSFLTPRELANAACVCRGWNRISKGRQLYEKVWTIYIQKNDPALYLKNAAKPDKRIMILEALTAERSKQRSKQHLLLQQKVEKVEAGLSSLQSTLVAQTTAFATVGIMTGIGVAVSSLPVGVVDPNYQQHR